MKIVDVSKFPGFCLMQLVHNCKTLKYRFLGITVSIVMTLDNNSITLKLDVAWLCSRWCFAFLQLAVTNLLESLCMYFVVNLLHKRYKKA
jgi:hypothetical protein